MTGANRSAKVLYNGDLAGILNKSGGRYQFTYDEGYLVNPKRRPVSIALPLKRETYQSEKLFTVFTNMLSEGANKVCNAAFWRSMKTIISAYYWLLPKKKALAQSILKKSNEPSCHTKQLNASVGY